MSEYTRVRNFHEPVLSSALHEILTYTWPNPTPVITYPSTAMVKHGLHAGVMTDVVTPGFILKRSLGQIVNSPMDRVEETYVRGSGSIQWLKTHPQPVQSHQDYRLSGNLTALWEGKLLIPQITAIMGTSINESNLIKLAGVKARTRINPILVQSLVSAVELPKTLSLIKESVHTLLNLRRQAVRGNLSSCIRILGAQRSKRVSISSSDFARASLSKRWLELRYGWTPLVFEVQGAIKALTKPVEDKPRRATVRGFEAHKSIKTNDTAWVSGSGLGNLTFRTTLEETCEVRAYCLFVADLKHQQARDFGVSEYPLAIWELVPFSFVVDWFVNVGNWIEALTPKLGVTILAEGVKVKKTDVYTRKLQKWDKVFFGSEAYDLVGDWSVTPDVYTKVRTYRVPNLNSLYSLPPIDVNLNVKRVVDAIALMAGRR